MPATTAPPGLEGSQRQQLTQVARENSTRILGGIFSTPDLLKQLRCLRLNVCLHLNGELEPLLNTTGQKLFDRQLPLVQEHLQGVDQVALSHDLAIMANCQRLFAPRTAQQDSAWHRVVRQANRILQKPADELLHGL